MRIPDVNKVSQMTGNPAPDGYVTDIYNFDIGEDVQLIGFLQVDGVPVNVDDWNVKVIVKSNRFSEVSTWEGVINNGIYMQASKPGKYQVIIPSDVFTCQPQGTYWLSIYLKEKVGKGKGIIDRTVSAMTIPITLNQSVISPNVNDPRVDAERTDMAPPRINITRL